MRRARQAFGVFTAKREARPTIVIAENNAGEAEVGDGKEHQVLVAGVATLVEGPARNKHRVSRLDAHQAVADHNLAAA